MSQEKPRHQTNTDYPFQPQISPTPSNTTPPGAVPAFMRSKKLDKIQMKSLSNTNTHTHTHIHTSGGCPPICGCPPMGGPPHIGLWMDMRLRKRVCMYVCVCVYVHVCVHVHVCMYVHVCVYVHVYVRRYDCTMVGKFSASRTYSLLTVHQPLRKTSLPPPFKHHSPLSLYPLILSPTLVVVRTWG